MTVQPGSCRRRSARLIAHGSPQWVLLGLLHEVRSPSWTPDGAAAVLLDQVDSCEAMRLARDRLRHIEPYRPTLVQARALATLNLAIHRLEDQRGTAD